jgi:hypothetical protein
MVDLQLEKYNDILVMMPVLVVSLSLVLYLTTVCLFKVYDYLENKKNGN